MLLWRMPISKEEPDGKAYDFTMPSPNILLEWQELRLRMLPRLRRGKNVRPNFVATLFWNPHNSKNDLHSL